MTEKEYRKLECLSQSDINLFLEDRKQFELKLLGLSGGADTTTTALGSLNHTLLFEQEEFHNRYTHFSGDVPTGSAQQKKFYELAFSEVGIGLTMEDAYCNCYSTKGEKPEAIKKKAGELYHKFLPYYNFMQENRHKEMITPEQELESRQMVDVCLSHPGVLKTLVAGRANSNFTILKEHIIIWEHHTSKRPLKSKVDEMHIDVENCVCNAYDYKTSRYKKASSFRYSVKTYGYDVQMSFYIEAIKYYLKKTYGKDFQVNFYFIPQSSSFPYTVLGVIQFTPSDIESAYLKWTTAIQELNNCIDTGQFENPEAYTETGITLMQLDNVVVLEEGDAF